MRNIKYTFKKILNKDSRIDINGVFKSTPQQGNLVYEYNPLRNYRLSENKYLMDNKFYSEKELIELKKIISNVFSVNENHIYEINGDRLVYMYIENGGFCLPKYTNDTKDYIYNLSAFFGRTYEGAFKVVYNNGLYGLHIVSGKDVGKWIMVKGSLIVDSACYYKFIFDSTSFDKIEGDLSFDQNAKEYYTITTNKKLIKTNINIDLYLKGSCVDLVTDELQFDLEHPVDIVPQYSYDGSVNLFMNDGKNPPKLINTRFSSTGKNTYQIVDRKGDNDTNIYNQGETFASDVSLYKTANTIAKIEYKGTFEGGLLPCGNYHFYFTYSDADGNETDFFAESGLISLFIGNSAESFRQGVRNESSGKGIEIRLTNLDIHYCYLNIYYSRSTGDLMQNAEKEIRKFTDRVFFSNSSTTLSITGYEDTSQITESDINPVYSYVQYANTQCFESNIYFLGNVSKAEIDYKELTDISLHFCPYLNTDKSYELDGSKSYSTSSDSYSNSKFIYNFTGYWPDEIYRLGIVYILNDTSLSPVFNIRGAYNICEYGNDVFTKCLYYKDEERNYIEVDQNSGLLSAGNHQILENGKGVVHFLSQRNGLTNAQIYGIDIHVDDTSVFDYLKEHTKGFFFVRQRRIPTTLCQAQSIDIDTENRHPTVYDGTLGKNIEEGFLNKSNRYLSDDFTEHKQTATITETTGMLCPDYDVNSPYLNNIFNGQEFTLIKSDFQPSSFTSQERHFWSSSFVSNNSRTPLNDIKIIGVEDSSPLVSAGSKFFSALAGNALMGYKFDCINVDDINSDSTNLIRGLWGPFLGLSNGVDPHTLYDIKIPNYDKGNMLSYFKIRMQDKQGYHAISDRFSTDELAEELGTFYRGDCYICKFTHRMNRNFNDDTAPYNSTIVNRKTWTGVDNGDDDPDGRCFEIKDGVIMKDNFQFINLGDINAVGLGMWVNVCLRSSINLNIRAIDESDTIQVAKTGHPKSFYPYSDISVDGAYKHAEALSYNKGYETSISTRYNYEVPDVPAIKNCFTSRIMYSNISASDSFTNGNRVFKANNFQDYTLLYGSLTKMVPYEDSIIAIFEHGIILLRVLERNLVNDNTNVYISSNKVISSEPYKVYSDTFGSQWKDSIIKTPYGLYGVDTVAKKIWRIQTNFECISDFKVQKYLNDNISLTERENTPIIGIRDVKSHYNKFKNDVMFTFYDNLDSVYEKAWNICYNENLLKFITFYSWIPSFSENIENQYFSFDRQTSKWISRLGNTSDVSLSTVIIPNNHTFGTPFANLVFNLGNDITIESVKILHDNLLNHKKFDVVETNGVWGLIPAVDVGELFSELFVREDGENEIRSFNSLIKSTWIQNIKNGTEWSVHKNSHGYRERLDKDKCVNSSTLVYFLNLEITYKDKNNLTRTIERQVYFTPEYNMLFLTTDFWKHGQAGIIDITDKIYPTYWYGKQHPFEFEFVVHEKEAVHKIFDNLIILSNSAEPESFHYEIVGDHYDFAQDKPTIYFRQEASEAFYQYHGFDTEYDTDFDLILSDVKQRHLYEPGVNEDGEETFIDKVNNGEEYVKSTVFPLYYTRTNGYDDIEDYYKLSTAPNRNYDGKSGTEVTYDSTTNEYHLWEHVKATNIKDVGGRLRSNMEYKEGRWNVLISPINLQLKNEEKWKLNVPPILTSNPPTLDDVEVEANTNDLFPSKLKEIGYKFDGGIDLEQWKDNKQIKIKDRYMKVRIRYSGKDLAIIQGVITLFRQSYA